MDKEKQKIDITENLKKGDFFKESREIQIQFTNWLLAIGVGLLLITISNLDKFILNTKIFLKPILIIYFIILGYAILSMGIHRFILFLSEFGISTFIASIKKRQWKMIKGFGDKKENAEKILESIDDYIKGINLSHNIILLKSGSIMLLLSILIITLCFILLILIKY